MRKILRFYENVQPANNRIFYLYDDIVNRWSDYRLQVRKNYINWLFPLETDIDTKLTKGLLYKFQTNENLRRKVIHATMRMMSFFGYIVVQEPSGSLNVEQDKPVMRQENNIVVGLYNPNNFSKITRILTFLNKIHMEDMSALFFLILCKGMKQYPDLNYIVKTNNVIQDWLKTQSYINKEKRYQAEETIFGEELESWEKSHEEI
jgi:hypothetical protein